MVILIMALVLTGCTINQPPKAANGSDLVESETLTQDTEHEDETNQAPLETPSLIDPLGETVSERLLCPSAYERLALEPDSFGSYLRNSRLKAHGSAVLLYDGRKKGNQDSHVAVFDIDVGDRDLQQCADATMRLWANYLRSVGREKDIHFETTSGFEVDYSRWMDGYRIKVEGNDVSWVKSAVPSNSDETFEAYMRVIFSYAGTLSLSRELDPVSLEDMQIGDVFVQGGSPGHAVIVVDMATHKETGERLFLLAQSYMPAQNIHILKNPQNEALSPWYPLGQRDIVTPEWHFTQDDLKRYD